MDMLVEPAVLANTQGIVVAANELAGRLFGFERPELVGHSVNQLMPKSYASRHDGFLRHYLKERGPKHLIGVPRPLPICHKGGRTITMEGGLLLI